MPLWDKLKYGIARTLNRRPSAVLNSQVHKTAAIGNGAQIYNSNIGRYTYVYRSSVICTDIGSFSSIAEECTIGGGNHPISWVSTSPVFHKGKNVLHKNFSKNEFEKYHRTVIGNDVWVGSKSLIKGGVCIGDGAIIGMGSVVTKDVPPYEIWAGVPAKFIRKRFDDSTIEKLQQLKWWELSETQLAECGDFFNEPDKLIKYLEGVIE